MPLFKCSKCGAMENTALGAYWYESGYDEPVLCSECDTGTWHGEFEKCTPEEAGYAIGKDGFYEKVKDLSR